MDTKTIITSLLSLLSGIGVFLIACGMLSSYLESLGARKLKKLFNKTTNSKLSGVAVGTVATAAIQSSSATTVMVIGFVNAGIMSLTQAATIIFGANIGTTITGQIVALGLMGSNTISASVILSTFAGIGAFILAFAKRDNFRKIGGALAGFGMIFIGLSLMSSSMSAFAQLESVKTFLASFKNHLLLVLIGATLTAIVQSSSAITSMTITMVVTGLVTLNQGIYITMGSNIGTCVTALIAAVTSGRNAKRAALIHLIFNVSGVVLFMLAGLFLRFGGITFGDIFNNIFSGSPQIQLAMFHSIFNLLTVIIVLPLTNLLVKAVTKIIPDKKEFASEEPRLHYIDEHMLATPPIAVGQVKQEIINMANIALTNFMKSVDVILTLNYSGIEQFRKNEEQLNFLNKAVAAFIVKLLKAQLSDKDRLYLSSAFHSLTDLERVGDYAENIIEYADILKDDGESFSSTAIEEIKYLQTLIERLFKKVIKAYEGGDADALNDAFTIEEEVDDITKQMAKNHIERLTAGICTPEVGAQYLSLSATAERVADHFINVAKTILDGNK